MRFIDLSATISNSPPETSELFRTDICYKSHHEGAQLIEDMFGVTPELLRDSEGWSSEYFTNLVTHSCTHVDAPWHYNSTIQGERAQTIDELPLDWFFAPGVKLDFRHHADGEVIDVNHFQAQLRSIDYLLTAGDIVLVHTGRDAFHDDADYPTRGPGVSVEATQWLFDQGVRVMGIDAWGWDRPLHFQAAEALKSNSPGIFWSSHQLDLPYAQIERLVNLGSLPASGFQIACFPLKIKGGSAGPARVVAMLAE